MALRRNRNRELPAPRNEPERIDLGALRAQQQRARAAAPLTVDAIVAAATSANRRTPPLVAYLDADLSVPLRRLPVALPPVDLAAEHDARLGELLAAVHHAHTERARLVAEWHEHEPGQPGFAAVLATCDADAIVAALTVDPARRFAAAWCAQAAVADGEQAVRDYAAGATELHARLDHATNERRDRIRALFVRARDREERRAYLEAFDLVPEWRTLAALYRWAIDPAQSYVPPSGDRVLPGDVLWAEYEAALALGEIRYEPPSDALDRPSPRPQL